MKDAENADRDRVRRWRSIDVADAASTPRATVLRSVIPAMLAEGVLSQRGRYWYARQSDIEAWLLGRWTPPAPITAAAKNGRSGRNRARQSDR